MFSPILSCSNASDTWKHILSTATALKRFFRIICWSTFLNAQTSVPAEHVLDLYCVRLSNAAPFCKNYTKLYFDPKHLEKGLNRVGVGGRG